MMNRFYENGETVMKDTVKLITLALLVDWVSIGCEAEETGEGTLAVEIWGEKYIEEGIPSAEFSDGYGVAFTKFLVNVREVNVGGELEAVESRIWDLSLKGPFEIASGTAPVGVYDETAYVIGPVDDTSLSGNASDADVQMMIDRGYAVYVEGEGSDGNTTKSFAWGFDTATTYDPCHSEASLTAGGQSLVQLTIHGDHLFYDSAVSTDPVLRFAEIASADWDGDNAVTPEELELLDLSALATHGVGSLHVDNMWEYITHMTTTLGHIDGEGHCEIR